jgi:serine/threonine protein kinase
VRKADGITKGSYQVAKWNGTKVAVKILDKDSYSDPDSINDFKHELTLLERVRHPNVVQFVGAVTQNIPMMIVAEYNAKGDLGSYIQKKGRLSPSKVLRFALDIARGMNYLHECKAEPIIHCDLKPKNILLDSGGQLKVSGFGLLRLSNIAPDKAKLTQPGVQIDHSNLYLAPEIFKDEVFDRSVDSHSFGLILYEMIEGQQPFHPKTPEEALRMICLEGKRPPFKIKARSYPPDLKELIEECWDEKSVVRPTFSEIIVRLDRIVTNCSKQGWWKDTFKLPWK